MKKPAALAGDALLVAIDNQAWHAAAKADLLRLDADLRVYAFLFDRAAGFWRDLLAAAESDNPLSRDQRFALDWVATEGLKAISSTKGA